VHNSLREMTFIIFYRFRLVLAVFLLFGISSTLVALLLPPLYQATAKFSLMVPRSLDPLRQQEFYDYTNRVKYLLQDQRELILSNRVLRTTVEQYYGITDIDALEKRVEKVRKRSEVVPPKGETFEGTSIFHVSFEDPSPTVACQFTDELVKRYLEAYGEIAKNKADQSHGFFMQQTAQLYEDMVAKEKELREYETRQALALIEILNLGSGEAKTNMEVGPNALLSSLIRKRYELQEEQAALQTNIQAIENELRTDGIPVVLPEMEATGRAISIFKNKIAQLQIELNEMKPRFTEDFSAMDQLKKELQLDTEALRKELERAGRAQKVVARGLTARIQQMDEAIPQLQHHIQSIAREKSVYEHLRQEYAIAKDAYTYSRNQLEQTRLASALKQEEQYLTLIDQPVVPARPARPNRPVLVVLGWVGGFLLSIAFALTADYFDHTIKNPQDIERHLGAPVLGSIGRVS
jgi:polysaccharide biosynthesis transport protein